MRTHATTILTVLLVLCLSCAGCAQTEEPPETADVPNPEYGEALNGFAFDLFRVLKEEESADNVLVSPLSISMALSMLHNGANGRTAEEIAAVLGYEDRSEDEINRDHRIMLHSMNESAQSYSMNLANAMWMRPAEPIQAAFIETMQENYDALVEELDFSRPDAADVMNQWIESQTGGLIRDMLTPPLSPEAVLYLVNAIHFRADWAVQFETKDTFDAQFARDDGTSVKVPMMNAIRTVLYARQDDMRAVRLPYADERRSMICILPEEPLTVDGLIARLDEDALQGLLASFVETEELVLQIPRFSISYGTKNLNDALQTLGMVEAFSTQADLSGIRQGLYVSRVLHKAFIEVDEQGSEAAAATVVEILESAAMEPETFRADRPFIFLILDEPTGSVLFLGTYGG